MVDIKRSIRNSGYPHRKDDLNEIVPKLTKYCEFLTKNKWDSEDIVQETLLKTLLHYDDHKRWNASLVKKIAYHLWIDHIRKKEKESLLSEFEIPVETKSVSEEEMDWLKPLFQMLTPKQLVAFVLKEAFQYKITEIADLLDMSDTGVKALLNRARIRVNNLNRNGNDIYWSEELEATLYPLILHAISNQDPSILIDLIPSIFATSVLSKHSASPSNVLSLAA